MASLHISCQLSGNTADCMTGCMSKLCFPTSDFFKCFCNFSFMPSCIINDCNLICDVSCNIEFLSHIIQSKPTMPNLSATGTIRSGSCPKFSSLLCTTSHMMSSTVSFASK
uniref:Uncharacterized protein n=1 Tax=Lotus japonicus TaxID=34305 RepID=I3SVP1_LOTJA|nr:unknown [Lotus japonicus]